MPETTRTQRLVVPLREKFFCDGAYYVISSSTIGGLSSEELAAKLSSGDEDAIQQLLADGVCIPIAFEGDCAMDHAIIIIGDLTPLEESEWIGKISGKLNIPCGNMIVTCGGGDRETIDGAVSGKGLGGFKDYFEVIKVEPGEYLIDVYAHMPSINGNFFFESDEPMKEWKEWYQSSRKGEELPAWLKEIEPYGMPGELSELVSHIIRLKPLKNEKPPIPQQDPESGWCAFEMRRPSKCPSGIPRSTLLN